MKLNKKFNDAEFKNVGFVIVYEKMNDDTEEMEYFSDAEYVNKLDADDLMELFMSGKLVVEKDTSGILQTPCSITTNGTLFFASYTEEEDDEDDDDNE